METKKRLSEWTLAECKEYCRSFSKECKWPCEKQGCILKRNNICSDWTHEWTFDTLTDGEKEIMRACGAKWVTKGIDESVVDLWDNMPHKVGKVFSPDAMSSVIATVDASLFPSVSGGDCIELED